MDKLVESLRVLLENERDGVLHVDGERLRQAKYAGSVEALRKILRMEIQMPQGKKSSGRRRQHMPTDLLKGCRMDMTR